MLARLLAIIQKEFIQTLRDRGALAIMISIPLLQLILFGYAINMNVQHIPLVAVDLSLDDASRAYLDDLTHSGYFDLVKVVPSQAAAIREIDLNQASTAVVIPPDFASNVRRGRADVLVLVDGSDLFTSLSAYNAANLIGQTHATRAALQKIERSGLTGIINPLEVHLNILYNPDFKDLWFIIPGIIALLLQTQTIVLTATSVVREREVGTIEQILVTPIRPMELMLGKIAPNIVLVMVNVLTILAIAVFWFKVPFQGSFWLFMSLSFLYAFSGLGLGLLISTVSQNNRQAMQLVLFISLLSIIIGGFIFPRYTMPGILQAIGNLFPLTYFVPISRGIITKGIGAQFLVVEILALVGYIVVIMIIAAPGHSGRGWINMLASFHRIAALTRKEMTQLWRDTRLLLLIILLPIILLFLFAYAVTLTVDHLPTAVADQSHDERSRDFIQTLVNSGYFDQTLVLQNEQELVQALDAGQVKAGILIPPDFSENVSRGSGRALILLDGSDSFTVQSGFNAASALSQKYSYDLQARSLKAGMQENLPILTSSRVLYNPDMNDLVFILPGLVGMLVQNIIVAYASMAIVRERELGIMEQILVTPARPAEMVIAKLIPGTIVAMLDMAIVLTLGIFWFGVPMRGSIFLFSALALIFILAYMGLGLMISAVAKTQRQAQQISVLLLLFGVLLTGFIFPRTSMPDWTQAIGDLIPLTYFVRISRGIISKGLAFDYLWKDTLILAAYALGTLSLASLFFKKRLD